MPYAIIERLEHELRLIEDLNYPKYFLTVYDIVEFARGQGILCQGRGAAANSAVCYCLGITAVDPLRVDMLFERFMSKERDEPPDIDIDFEHERREEVLQYIYKKYGRDRAALTAEVITYRGRSAVREVGKALGLSLDTVDRMAKQLDWWDSGVVADERVRELGLDPRDRTVRLCLALTGELLGFPRHLSQHVGGFVITQGKLEELVPIENAAMADRTVIEWDKDDIDAMGFLKVDCLGLGMLTCVSKGLTFVNNTTRDRYEMRAVPPEDPRVYDMICEADTVGVFQVESRAQMTMLPRLRPRHYYDLVIEVAIVRPGPIQGKMVHPYLKRRNGEEPVWYPDERIEKVLGRTLGVPLFQEQAMALSIEAAGFSGGEADNLRRSMAAWKRKGHLLKGFEERIVKGMMGRGYSEEFAHATFNQIRSFGEYGFPESHAASFALIVYVSAWLKRFHPAAFCAALINSQPMGFYAPAQLVRDAQEHGVEVREVDVNLSGWDCALEEGTEAQRDNGTEGKEEETENRGDGVGRAGLRPADESTDLKTGQWHDNPSPGRFATTLSREGRDEEQTPPPHPLPEDGAGGQDPHSWGVGGPALRLGMRLVKGLREEHAQRIAEAVRAHGAFGNVGELWRASGVPAGALKKLASADAFGSMGLSRREALWQIRALRDDDLPLFDPHNPHDPHYGHQDHEPVPRLPVMPPDRAVAHDYASVGLSLKAHPVSFYRDGLKRIGARACAVLRDEDGCRQGTRLSVAGIVLMRQRPGTASGVVFMTLEDETGIANLILRPKIYKKYRKAARHSVVLLAHGHVERQGSVVHVLVSRVENLDGLVQGGELKTKPRNFR